MSRASCKDHIENKKMNGKVEESAILACGEVDHSLDLKLSSTELDHPECKLELNLLDIIDTDSPMVLKSSIKSHAEKVGNMKLFTCKYCNKKFTNCQALGGHQNAHRRERAALKRENRVDNLVSLGQVANHFYPYPAMAAAGFYNHGNLHGPFDRPLGVNMHSMIHKPFHALPPWSKPQFSMKVKRADDYWFPGGGVFQVKPLESIDIKRKAPCGWFGSSMLTDSEAATNKKIAIPGQGSFRGSSNGYFGNQGAEQPAGPRPNLSLSL